MLEKDRPFLKDLTTLRLGGHAIASLIIGPRSDLATLEERLRSLGGKPFCLGRGSNLLAMDEELPYVLIHIADRDIQIKSEVEGQVLVRAGAGATVSGLLNFCLKNGLSGLEGLVGIPGTVGGACAMNAGSFGCDIGSVFHSALLWENGHLREYTRDKVAPAYRKMVFGENTNGIILEVIFALTRKLNGVIFNKLHLNFLNKKSRQPLKAWSAGCAFKNPAGSSAGYLIEQAGLKGKRLGGMAFSEKHANFLINEGKGSAGAALELMSIAMEKVRSQSGHILEPEIRILR